MHQPGRPHMPGPGQQPNVQQLERKVADLEKKLNALTAVLQVNGPNVVLKGTNVTIEGQAAMNMKAGSQMVLAAALIKLN